MLCELDVEHLRQVGCSCTSMQYSACEASIRCANSAAVLLRGVLCNSQLPP